MKVIKGLVLLCLMMLAGCQSEEETSQFLLACKYDAPATIAAMLDNGIDVDGQDKTGLSGLMVAAAEIVAMWWNCCLSVGRSRTSRRARASRR